ncbi:NERD domain-containing protein [Acinetobacter junii]|uniref:NERD domain-containing protein n=1 Tax=Acinetobacter junii TaxID=40215 RepID=UPI001FB501EA|nr:NERD domain-containing protein [Acinetobacter junii]UOB53656.1 YraN family protein [Acinetobacter junii]
MNNYYEEKFTSLFTEFGAKIALEKIVEDLLYKSSQPKIGVFKNKFDMFWQSNFISLLTEDNVRSQNYILALSQYIRYTIHDKKICLQYLKLDLPSFILAIRYSGIILNFDHSSWEILKVISEELNIDRLDTFMETVEYLRQQYKYRLEHYDDIKNKLNIGQVTAMIFSSLYAYEYLIPHKEIIDCIPYQYDKSEDNSSETIWKAFEEIIKNARKNKVVINEKMIFRTFEKKYFPIITGENIENELVDDYETFKMMVAIKVELHNFKRNVLQSYSFNKKIDYFVKKGEFVHVSDVENDNWYIKNSINLAYWNHIGVLEYIKSDLFSASDLIAMSSDRGIGIISNIFGIIQQLKQVYGIDEIYINEKSISIFDALLVQTSIKMHSINEHLSIYENLLESYDSYEAQMIMFVSGLKSQQLKLPLLYSTILNRCSKQFSLLYGGSKKGKLQRIHDVYEFWSCDLKNTMEDFSFSHKPFLKIDDIIFQFPWISGVQNINTSVVNYLRKLHKNRLELKKETSHIELRLGSFFEKVGFKVFCSYNPLVGDSGEIDLIAIYKNHVIVVEVKSTYIRSSIQEIYEYRNFTLNKAAYQLTKKVEYVKSEFICNYLKNIEDVKVHSWIVDTTLEFDHEYFDNHLKISLDEIIITLNGDTDFMSSIVNGSFMEKENKNVIDPLEFIQAIESNDFWKKQLINYDDYMSKMMD